MKGRIGVVGVVEGGGERKSERHLAVAFHVSRVLNCQALSSNYKYPAVRSEPRRKRRRR
jgi:hypothetical protein